MHLGIPLSGSQETSPPRWLPIEEGLTKIKVRARVPKTDWRSKLAERNGDWLIWVDLDDDDEFVVGIGVIDHKPNEKEIRKTGQVSVRPFRRPATTAIIQMILGTIRIPESQRHIWAPLDGLDTDRAGALLKGGRWWMIREHPDNGAPTTVFNPARWQEDLEREDRAGITTG